MRVVSVLRRVNIAPQGYFAKKGTVSKDLTVLLTDMALIRRGCVQITLHVDPLPFMIASSKMNCAT